MVINNAVDKNEIFHPASGTESFRIGLDGAKNDH